jgi:hypothetical protein
VFCDLLSPWASRISSADCYTSSSGPPASLWYSQQTRMRLKANVVLLAGCGLLLLIGETLGFGCARKPTMKVIVPENFHGNVSLSCTSFGDVNQTITVGSDGRLDNVTCPTTTSRVEIQRAGKPISSKDGIDWQRTGDDIPVGVRFAVP